MKKPILKTFIPISAVAAVFGLAAGAQAQTTPVFEYDFPASWNGTGSTIVDQSTAGNDGFFDGTLSLSSAVPSGASGQSLDTSAGGILTSGTALLDNATIAAAGGFEYDVSFMWNGGTTSWSTQKIIDYAGTESLQLNNISGSSADLQIVFSDDTGAVTTPISTPIAANTWYNVKLTFDNASMVGGDVVGTASLYLDGSLVTSASATKGTYGDGLSRQIGIGQLGANFGYLVGFDGNVYNPSVTLVPEPSTLALGALGGLALLGFRRRKS